MLQIISSILNSDCFIHSSLKKWIVKEKKIYSCLIFEKILQDLYKLRLEHRNNDIFLGWVFKMAFFVGNKDNANKVPSSASWLLVVLRMTFEERVRKKREEEFEKIQFQRGGKRKRLLTRQLWGHPRTGPRVSD